METKTQTDFDFNIDDTDLTQESATESLPIVLDQKQELELQSKDILNQIVVEKDPDKVRDLTYLFNQNQNKKTMARVDRCNEVLDSMLGQWSKRVVEKPDEMDHETLLRGIKTIQELMERGQKQVAELSEQSTPMIQINQQNNEVHIGNEQTTNLSRDSRERVRQAVLGILSGLGQPNQQNIINTEDTIIDAVEVVEDEEDD